jgi:hypothetical protein
MKRISIITDLLFSFFMVLCLASCRKELPGKSNRPPVANAGADQTLTLPVNQTELEGFLSTDPDNNITAYTWTKIEGPSSFLMHPDISKKERVLVTDLVPGVYRFELKVTDAGGLFSKDTVQVTVSDQPPPPPADIPCDNSNRPQINARLVPAGVLSQARSGMAVASAGNKIVFAGGGGTLYADGPSAKVDIYDVAAQAWSAARLSDARSGMGAVSAGNKIFFAGGDDNFVFPSYYAVVDIYDATANTWSTGALSEPRSYVAAATVGNKVFFAGGYSDNGVSNRVDIYDLGTNTWTTALLSEARGMISAVTVGNKIYFAGGNYYSTYYNRIDIYDNLTNSWSTSSLSELEGYLAGIAVGSKIYWAVGCKMEIRDVNSGSSSVDYLFKQGAWFNDLGQNAVLKDNQIIFFRHYTDDASRFDIYDIASHTWSIGVLPANIEAASIISVNNTIYLAGGWRNANYADLSSQVWKLEF